MAKEFVVGHGVPPHAARGNEKILDLLVDGIQYGLVADFACARTGISP